MSDNPKVSVIIPVYNTEKYLRECLDSVVNQTLKDIEIICIDDGSTDSSLNILNEYAEHDDRFTIITQENQGAGAARNRGLKIAKGEYLSFLDADDFLTLKNSLEKLFIQSLETNSDICVCLSNKYDNTEKKFISCDWVKNTQHIKNKKIFNRDDISEYLYQFCNIPAFTKLYKNTFIKENEVKFQEIKTCNDVYFNFYTLALASRITMLEDELITYRLSNDQLSKTRGAHIECVLSALTELKKALTNKNLFKSLDKTYYKACSIHFRYELEQIRDHKEKIYWTKKLFSYIPKEYWIKSAINLENRNSIQPKVSIIIPVYNSEKYLRKCLDSVVNQTLQDIEIICVNDGSTDNSLNILNEYALIDNRIIIIDNKKNIGAPGAIRNIGMKIAKGEYIAFLDSDDYISSNLLESLYLVANKNHAQIAAIKNLSIFSKTKPIKNKNVHANKVLKNTREKTSLIKNSGTSCGKLYKMDFIKKYNFQFTDIKSIAEDNYFSIMTMLCANKIVFVDNCQYYYRKHSCSYTAHKRDFNDFNIIEIYKKIENSINKTISNKNLKKKYLESVKQRKIQDFNWFLKSCKPECKLQFKDAISKAFPNIAEYFKPIIISLTSYPARINTVHLVIESILNQTIKADKVILWLAEEQFPNKEKDLPQQLLNLIPQGLIIDWYHDIKSYKKLIPTLKKYPDNIIVTADDDIIYSKNWLKNLYGSYKKHPKDIQAHRVTKFKYKHGKFTTIVGGKDYYKGASYLNKLTGVGGVLYPPNCFYKDILNEDLIMKLAPTNDDQWFWLQAALNGTKVRVVNKAITKINYIPNTQETALCKINDNGEKLFWKDFDRLIEYYPKLKTILVNEYRFMKIRQLFNLQKIFSIKNKDIHKVITICGLKLKFKSNKLVERKRNKEIDKKFKKLGKQVKTLKTKVSEQQKSFKYELCKYMPENKYPEYLKDWYKRVTGETLNLNNPQTYNEKIQWMKLYDSTPLKTQLADKYLVRNWVAEKIGEEYLIPLLGVWNNFDEIDFNKLPDKFVLKCNHGCAYNIIVTDKYTLDIADARKKINYWMNENFAYRVGLELHYANINRKIIAEQYIENDNSDLYDYKFWCFDGKVKYIQFLSERNTNGLKMAFYDRDWNKQEFVYSYPLDTKTIEKPDNLEEMIYLAEKLAEGFNHVRVDFYRLNNGKIYFGEMTFTSCSGRCMWTPNEENLIMGQMIKLPIDEKVLTEV